MNNFTNKEIQFERMIIFCTSIANNFNSKKFVGRGEIKAFNKALKIDTRLHNMSNRR